MEGSQMSKNIPDKVVMHPLVLLSVVDHYSRVAKDTDKRVVGILLGSTYKGVVDITNSYAGTFIVFVGSASDG
jgi:26S proteasome regulatory subunit N8